MRFQKKFLWIVFSFASIGLQSCSGSKKAYVPTKKLSPQQLKEDFDIGWKTYQKNHPSYDWYTPADSINARFAAVRASLTDSLTEPEFRLRLSYAVSLIRCGHTSVIPSKSYQHYAKDYKGPSFPLAVKIWGKDSMVVLQNFLGDTLPIKRGTILTGINDIPVDVFIEQMKQYASTDGFSDGFKENQISASFPARFRWLYGLAENYQISYLDSAGQPAKMRLPNFFPGKKDSLHIKTTAKTTGKENQKSKKKKNPSYGKLSIDTARDLAIMELNTFSHSKLPRYIRSSFKKIKKNGVTSLVIDLRSNGGGKIDNSTLLTRYVIDKPFRVADSASAKDLRIAYPQYTQAAWLYRYFRWTFSKKKEDGRWHMQQTEKKVYKPIKKNHFDGHAYLLTGGTTFSASLLFLSKVYQQENVTIVGEETGGGARGNSAVMIPKITLPNSKVQLRLPLFRLISDVHIPQNGRGIMPEVFVRPGARNIRGNTDAKMEKVYEIISTNQNK
jgi:hypothetical protein